MKVAPSRMPYFDPPLETEVEILKRASAYFTRKNVLPKEASGWSPSSPLTGSPSRWPVGRAEGLQGRLLRVARSGAVRSPGHR